MAIADLTPDQREQAEAFLEDAVKLQHEFWDTLSELERVVGFNISSDRDFEGYTLEELEKACEEEEEND